MLGMPLSTASMFGFFETGNFDFIKSYVDYVGEGTTTSATNLAWNSDCEILQTTTQHHDQVCYFDINELDVWFQGLEIQFNAPPGMCSYFTVEAPYYYAYEFGQGASNVTYSYETENGGVRLDGGATCSFAATDSQGTETENTCAGVATLDFRETYFEVTSSQITPRCIYDYSIIDEDLPNCCIGNYTVSETVTADGSDPTVTISQRQWSDDYSGCFGGPALNAAFENSGSGFPTLADGRPIGRIFFTENDGINDKLVITPPMEASIDSNLRVFNTGVANYFTPDEHTHNGIFQTGSATEQSLPVAFAPIDDRSGTTVPMANPYYRFTCLDDASEVIHQVTLYVREWNTLAAFNAAVSGGQTGDIIEPTNFDDDVGSPNTLDEDGVKLWILQPFRARE